MLRALLSRFRRDDRANATVEFVIVFPLMVLCLIGGFVYFDVFRAQSKAGKALYTVTDIMSRQESVDEAFLEDLYVLIDNLLPNASDNKYLRITSVTHDGTSYEVDWSWVRNPDAALASKDAGDDADDDDEGDAENDLSLMHELTSARLPLAVMPAVAEHDSVVLLELTVPYTPLVDFVGIPEMEWTPRTVVRPRFIGSIVKE
ncbi:MAG: TadE/TadG family type IV pilus assembly protein [Pseudomonadota bacterium]